MKVENVIQGSPEWKAIRCGRVTASRIADLTARTKTGYSASRANYMAELIAERLTGTTSDKYTNAAMEWGSATEADARAAYEFHTGFDVTEVGFVHHPMIDMAGASPDGLVGDFGLVEIKCPNTATHIETLLGGRVPEKYVKQMQFQMACAGRSWCDFVSFDPRLPESMRLFVSRVECSVTEIDQLESEVVAFLGELDARVKALTDRYERRAA
jgi:putative phage-type endonuclease